MTCNITERFFRIVAGATLFVLLTAANAAFSAEPEENMKSNSDSRAEASSSTASDASAKSQADGNIQVEILTPDSESIIENSEAIADATYHFVEDVNSAAQSAVAETVAQEVGATVDASIKEDVRINLQEDLQSELTGSLPLPGQD